MEHRKIKMRQSGSKVIKNSQGRNLKNQENS